MKTLFVLLCYLASGQCEWLPWTDHPRDPHLGKPFVYSTEQECENAGQFWTTSHSGHYPFKSPGYDLNDFQCKP